MLKSRSKKAPNFADQGDESEEEADLGDKAAKGGA